MDELEVRRSVAEILEVAPEELKKEDELDSFEMYDSTARLSLMVCLSDLTGQPVELAALQQLRTYGDVLALVKIGSANERNA
jgi:acyl carrier protein